MKYLNLYIRNYLLYLKITLKLHKQRKELNIYFDSK